MVTAVREITGYCGYHMCVEEWQKVVGGALKGKMVTLSCGRAA